MQVRSDNLMLIYVAVLVLLFSHTLSKTCNIKDYGAKGDGTTDDQPAITAAIKDCASGGGGTVEIPSGTFLATPFELQSNLVFQLDKNAQIFPPEDPSKWPQPDQYIKGSHISNVTFTGSGLIDGKGKQWWDRRRQDPSLPAPDLIQIKHSSKLNFYGITLQNSPRFHLDLEDCQDVVVSGISIFAPEGSPNTDGIDFSGQGAHITGCKIENGDDNVAIKPQGSSASDPTTKNILVENCYFATGHGASIGSINDGQVENVTIRNCQFTKTHNCARIKTWQGGKGYVRNILYQSLTLSEVNFPIRINQYYCPSSQHPEKCKNETAAVQVSDITFDGIKGTQTDGIAASLMCANDVPCTSITLKDIDITPVSGQSKDEFLCWNAHGTSSNVYPKPCF